MKNVYCILVKIPLVLNAKQNIRQNVVIVTSDPNPNRIFIAPTWKAMLVLDEQAVNTIHEQTMSDSKINKYWA